jgi:hypothetical protein
MNAMIVITSASLVVVSVAGLGVWRYFKTVEESSTVLLEKYAALYKLLTHRRNAEIVKARPGHIVVKMQVNSDQHILSLEEIDERLVISWKLISSETGKANREWSFNPNYPQNYMYQEVLKDIMEFQLKQIRSKRVIVNALRLQTA